MGFWWPRNYACHTSIFYNQAQYWRNGVVISHEDNVAFIKAAPDDKKIFIEVVGNNKRVTLSFIRGQLQIIHNTLSKINAMQMIPLDEEGKAVVEYDRLVHLRKKGREIYDSYELDKEFYISKLLGEIENKVEESFLEKKQIETLIQDCADSLNESQIHLNLMKLNIPPAIITHSSDSLIYCQNVVHHLVAIKKLIPWLENLEEYWFAQKWLRVLK